MKIFLQNIKKGMYFFADLIANTVNVTLLFLVYCTVLALTAIIAKIFGKRFLSTDNSSWLAVDKKDEERNYFRQF